MPRRNRLRRTPVIDVTHLVHARDRTVGRAALFRDELALHVLTHVLRNRHAGVAALLSLAFIPQNTAQSNDLRVTLLSLGAGQCAVVELPGGHVALIDAGSSTVADVAVKLIEPFLRAHGEQQVDEIFLSHGDFDHISAAGEIATAYDVHDVFTSHHFWRNAAGNIPDQMLLEELEKLNKSPKEVAVGEQYKLGNGAAVGVAGTVERNGAARSGLRRRERT